LVISGLAIFIDAVNSPLSGLLESHQIQRELGTGRSVSIDSPLLGRQYHRSNQRAFVQSASFRSLDE
jgi:hypothetical protein